MSDKIALLYPSCYIGVEVINLYFFNFLMSNTKQKG